MRFTRALTLVEVLVVIGIITLLAGLSLLAFGPGLRLSRTEPTCANNLRQLAVSLNLYMAENDGGVPRVGFVRYESFRGKPYVRCPLNSAQEHYSDALTRYFVKSSFIEGTPSNPGTPANPEYPRFDIEKDVLFRCRKHGYDGFESGSSMIDVNFGFSGHAGRTLGVRLDTSVRRVPYVSCWELGTKPRGEVSFLPAIVKSCDRPLD
jgi:hypothetical protein